MLSGSACSSGNLSCLQVNSSFVVGVGLNVSGLEVTIWDVLLNFSGGNSSSFGLSYLYGGAVVCELNVGVVVSGFCESPCLSCNQSASLCLSCLGAPNLLQLSLNSVCVSSCPAGYFEGNGSCEGCQPSCSTCQSSSLCSTCAPNYFSFNNTCINQCPPTTFLNTTTSSNITDSNST